ncbi:MAG: hypothetical protein J6X30_03515 [Clostridia bacterium]|nr:hypothetical protein [Clostridia bacterium]
MKSILRFSFRLFLTQVATGVIAFISMMLVLSADIAFIYKMLIGLLFVFFNLFMTANNAFGRGTEDEKTHVFAPYKGFLCGVIAMIPALVLTLAYMVIAYHGWEKGVRATADGLYVILYLVFLAYSPTLSVFVSFNPALSIDFAQPAIAFLQNITTPNAVSAPLFFVPICAVILTSGIAYLAGHASQHSLKEALLKAKKLSKNQPNT